MANYNTTANIVLSVNGKQAQKMLSTLERDAQRLEKQLAKAATAGDKATMKKLQRELNATKRTMEQLKGTAFDVENVLRRLDKATPKELQRTLKTLEKQLNGLKRGSEEWQRQAEHIKRVKAEVQKVNSELRQGEGFWERFNRKMNDWQTTLAAGAAAVTGLVMAGRAAVNAYAEMDAEMANVRKFTGMTAEEVESLNKEFLKIDTRTSRDELNRLAQEAGRLGKTSQEDVLGFVKAADVINVALDDLGEGATLTLSKLTNIFGVEQELGTERSLLAVGSVINELSQNCTASAPYLANFAKRLAGVGAQAEMTIPQIMGFAAVLDSQGQAVEMSATALSKLIMSLFKNTEKIAAATGMDLQKFKDALASSTNEGLLMLIERLHELGSMDVLAPVFADMGENGARASAVISALAGNLDMVRWEQEEAARAFEEATSVTKEFNVQNNTVQAELDKARKRVSELAISLGEKLAPIMKHIYSTSSIFLRALSALVEFVYKYKREILTLVTAIAAYNAVMLVYNTRTAMATRATALFHGALNVARKILPAVKLLFTPLINAVQYFTNGLQVNYTMQQRWRKSLEAMNFSHWVGLILSLAGAVYMVVSRLRDNAKEAEEARRKQEEYRRSLTDLDETSAGYCAKEVSRLDELYKASTDEAKSVDERMAAAERLQKLYPDYFKNLSAEEIMVGKAKTAYDKLRDSIIEVARARAAAEKITENEKELLTLEQQAPGLQQARDDAKVPYDNAVREWENARQQESYQSYGNSTDAAVGNMVNVAPYAREVARTGEVYEAAEAAYQENLTKQRQLNEANEFLRDKYKISADAIYEEPETPTVDLTDFGNGGTGDGSGAATDRFAAEKEWREQQEASARIAYAKGETDYVAHTERMNQILVEFYERQLLHTDFSETERLQIMAQWEEAKRKQREDAAAATLEEENARYNEQTAELKQFYIDGSISKETYDIKTEEAEIEHQRRLVTLTKEGSKERLQAEAQLQSLLIAQMQRRQAETAKLEEKYAKMKSEFFGDNPQEAQAKYDADLAVLQVVYDREIAAAGDNVAEKLRIEEAFEKAKLALKKKYGLLAEEDTRNAMERGIADSLEWLESDGGKAVVGTMETLTSGMAAVFSQLSSLMQAELEIQTAAINKRYDAEINRAEGNTYQIKRLEAQKEKEIAKAKNEANRKMFAMQVIQAVAQTATNALSAYGSAAAIPVVGYILAPIAAAMAVAAGAIQIAAIKKQQQASEAQGYQSGGFTPAGRKDEAVGVVHAGEWVASQALVNNPRTRPLLEALDYAQRTNTIGSIRMSDVSRTINAPALIAAQGSAAPTIVNNTTNYNTTGEPNSEYADTMRRLADRLDEPMGAIVTIAGEHGIARATEEYDRLIKNKSPKSKR